MDLKRSQILRQASLSLLKHTPHLNPSMRGGPKPIVTWSMFGNEWGALGSLAAEGGVWEEVLPGVGESLP